MLQLVKYVVAYVDGSYRICRQNTRSCGLVGFRNLMIVIDIGLKNSDGEPSSTSDWMDKAERHAEVFLALILQI